VNDTFELVFDMIHQLKSDIDALNFTVANLSAIFTSSAGSARKAREISCPFTEGRPFEGIIQHLADKLDTLLTDHVVCRSSSTWMSLPLYSPHNILKFTSQDYFCSNNKWGEWVLADFRSARVRLSHYTIESLYGRLHKGGPPKSWVLEGLSKDREWIELDRRDAETALHRPDRQPAAATFQISHSRRNTDVSIVRIRQMDVNLNGDNCLLISRLELFGTLID
jgi:hypothetical protein